MSARRVFLARPSGDLAAAVRAAMEGAGLLEGLSRESRVAIKPNLTYPYPRAGVTTSPELLWEVVRVLRDHTEHVAVVESDGGYGVFSADQAFEGHGLRRLADEFGVELVNLCGEASEPVSFVCRGRTHTLPLPVRLLHATDRFITLPVPKVHSLTGLTLSYKNQWGCIPDTMRLRRHYLFDDAVVAINRALRPMVLGDGTTFLDRSGPLEGEAVPMDLVIAATDPGTFDRYVSELMGWSWRKVSHLRRAQALGDLPASLDDVLCNVLPSEARTRTFALERTPRNWIALAGFRSRFLTWLGYESWFGRVVLHGLLYAVAGRPVPPSPEEPLKVTRS